jgi:hypothetical protein
MAENVKCGIIFVTLLFMHLDLDVGPYSFHEFHFALIGEAFSFLDHYKDEKDKLECKNWKKLFILISLYSAEIGLPIWQKLLLYFVMLFVVIVLDIHTVKTSKNCIHKLYKE